MKNHALLFLNGTPPKNFPDPAPYQAIACTDGAFHYLKDKKFPLERLDFISGDFDSHSREQQAMEAATQNGVEVICTPDQDKTDFEKALEILLQRGSGSVDVLGGSGGEMDHFLGNLSVAYEFRERLAIRFFDEFSEYFFIPNTFSISGIRGRMVSLYPFPEAHGVTTTGLNWPLTDGVLSQTGRIGTRNFALGDSVEIRYTHGAMLLFIGEIYR